MTIRYIGAAACSVLLLGVVTAQDYPAIDQDRPNAPVPVRLTAEVYRAQNAVENSVPGWLTLDCNLEGEYTSLRVQGGEPGADVVVLLSAAPAAIHTWGIGTLLVSPAAVPVLGQMGPDGTFEQPINLADPRLAGHAVYTQAVQWEPNRTRLSEGLSLRFAPGNEQTGIHYTGPRMTAIPCKAIDETIPTLYSVLVEFDPGIYHDVRLVGVYEVGDQRQAIMVELVGGPNDFTPSPLEGGGGWACYAPVKLREVVDLGPFPHPVIEVWVGIPTPSWAPPPGDLTAPVGDLTVPAGVGGCVVYEMAAVVDLRY